MGKDDKTLQTKHAHITGQAMRDHWGPIIDRIADETADWRDARIEALEAENERLREALWRIANGDGIGGPDAELQCADIARAALGDKTND